MALRSRHLLGIAELTGDEIRLILDTATTMKEVSQRAIKKVPTLRGRTVVNLFLEPSTRTRSSFEIAERRLSADSISIGGATSSVVKGETLLDTARSLQALQPDAIVVRHSSAGCCSFLARHTAASIINAGDGAHEHPTQALLDALTIREHKGRIDGLKVAIIGDLAHSRVVRSNILLLRLMGAEVWLSGPRTLFPVGIDSLGARLTARIEEAIDGADVVMMLRVQRERLKGAFLASYREYFTCFGLDAERLARAKPDAIVMHPGPINRGVEMASDVADGPRSVVSEQVANGLAVRMAVLYLLIGTRGEET